MRIMRIDALLTSDLVIVIWMTDVGLKKETGGKTMEPVETLVNSRVRVRHELNEKDELLDKWMIDFRC